ncbi:RNA polymerase II Elongator complex associated protein Kti12 [Aspergillus nomiae NRRL 13137]|uniref:RNA polymerase II Elongator complex associated protein Kti12 n=1 Tax=Aspergillus nomiae NRRL (strain ATCC 15546 / NRRL 13137 / CBS 260.88 / M93) TaxID=1509407 RepID=A0A0L1JE21_ASPN3|nr:RNA polymerase II Elongator complex associated protein Kti12 [Aspergillus nomiae NRRL 13137]KNG90025.1 RNA polymerase II Elongator complex associated protein Kti12 [Aspergillus nomiae NRRL 13137]
MPLIILTGYPCSGLTHRANQLAAGLQETQETVFAESEKPPYKIHVVSTHDENRPRTVYDHARTEKEARGVAYTRARRMLGKDSFVILDGMNYIKGYRYQLWCEAKALGTTCCVVHVGTPIDQCVANNEARIHRQSQTQPQSESESQPETETTTSATDTAAAADTEKTTDTEHPYPPALLQNLIFRYEEPSTHSRWDKPLFTVPWSDAKPPIAEIWTALTGIAHPETTTETTDQLPTLTSALTNTHLSSAASIAPSTTTKGGGSFRRERPKIKPHLATVQPTSTESGLLYSMEKRTSAVVSAIRSFVVENPSAEGALAKAGDDVDGIRIVVPEVETAVFIPAHVAMTATTDELGGAGGILAVPRLQRLRRQWITLNRTYVARLAGTKSSMGADQVGDAFVRFLNADFAGEGAA